jgi:alkanesulfonate monooxygenase SsuD/methylene tetrahydromethanopterin reductase-like flavin-dependent oxidoreductase (luciferase family)
MGFRPTLPPAGRLVRLGLILDTRSGWPEVLETARMCDGSGMDALWVEDHVEPRDDAIDEAPPPREAWTVLSLIARDVRRTRLGVILNPALRPPAVMAAMASTLDDALGGRLELSFTAGPDLAEDDVSAVRRLLDGPTIAIAGATEPAFDVAARLADDVVLPPSDPVGIARLVGRLRAACERNDRDPATVGVAMVAPVSIGRTTAEASARADADPQFRTVGSPREVGVFGTLEQCQERVIELAHAGVADLRCVVPNAPDMPDVLAQLTAIAIGTIDVLTPGSPRSKSPDPPAGWGGRGAQS